MERGHRQNMNGKMNCNVKRALVLAGPTAIGKTAIAERIALELGGEIISADSRQIYRKLDIGTAKAISPKVRHRLVDIIEPTERYDAARFVSDALNAMESIASRGLVPIIVGGTGMYIRALTVGIFPGEFRDNDVRKELGVRHDEGENLYMLLQRIDPDAARTIDPNNFVRIERAIEVFIVSGRPISFWWHNSTKPPAGWNFVKIGLTMDRKLLYERIARRAQDMLDAGWVEEVRTLLQSGIPENAQAFSSIGYRSVLAFIKRRIDSKEMLMQIIRETKQYARRQMTWFRREPDIQWLDITGFNIDIVVKEIIDIYSFP